MAGITFDDVTKVYGDGHRAVSDLNLDVKDGEFVVLVGPSGCGKTTALRMVAGLEEITDGQIRIGERVVNNLPPGRARHRDGLPELRALPAHDGCGEHRLRAEDAQGAEGGDPEEGRGDRAHPRARRPSSTGSRAQLSGGQRQRVAMGRAIVREPQVFLMDEPLSNLDAKLRVQMRAEISRIQRQLGGHDDVRHARPGRGDDDGRPRRGDAQGRAAAVRRAAARCTSARPTSSSRASSAVRR